MLQRSPCETNNQNRFTVGSLLLSVRVLKDTGSEGVDLCLFLPLSKGDVSYFIVNVKCPENGGREILGFVTEELDPDPSLDGKANRARPFLAAFHSRCKLIRETE